VIMVMELSGSLKVGTTLPADCQFFGGGGGGN
jgi:hypothetical protein